MTPHLPGPPHDPACARRAYQLLGETVVIVGARHNTLDAYALFEAHTPVGRGMPLHLQRYDDEALIVLEGTYVVQIGQKIIELAPGGCTFVPRGTIHAYTNTGSAPARLLIITSPGGIHEQFFVTLGKQVDPLDPHAVIPLIDESRELARVAMRAVKYGIEFASAPDEPS